MSQFLHKRDFRRILFTLKSVLISSKFKSQQIAVNYKVYFYSTVFNERLQVHINHHGLSYHGKKFHWVKRFWLILPRVKLLQSYIYPKNSAEMRWKNYLQQNCMLKATNIPQPWKFYPSAASGSCDIENCFNVVAVGTILG